MTGESSTRAQGSGAGDGAVGGGLESILGPNSLHTDFAPIVDLLTNEVIGYEANVSGPENSAFRDPSALASAARAMDMTVDLDLVRWAGAVDGAAKMESVQDLPLFIAIDPDTLPHLPDRGAQGSGNGTGTAVLQLDETALIRRPAQLLRAVADVRRLGWAIAVDHVGVRPESLALLPLLEPDVVKLDRSLITRSPGRFTARVVNAVAAYTERTGAIVMAEGIDTEEGVSVALALGARVGQGRYFTEQNPTPVNSAERTSPLNFRTSPDRGSMLRTSPYQLAVAGRDSKPSTKRLLVEVSKGLESTAAQSLQTAVILGSFEQSKHFTPLTAHRWEVMATRAALVGALAVGMDAEPAPRVRGANLEPNDPVRDEWVVVVLSPHFSAVLAAKDLGDTGPEMQRRFSYVLSHDPQLTVDCARSLMLRLPVERTGL
ncbi:EAL domain-containing protein [Rhodococcus sp. BGS-1C]|jgi:EAL domain-containing protein (putative c-di-GMP-specific phosphodiesterase class I)|uniref:EAL domain-containing protein n=1 Tax=unclassified Rhodococcus (in: high G+C Gram-positive bacteria) TaxID=192944 RepID=UPI0019D092B6|nr:EAL domain-containing protein [Rhodococcus sp. KRD197]